MSFNSELLKKVEETEATIKAFLPIEAGYQKTVLEAMNYSVLAGGKRIRPLLMAEAHKFFGGNAKSLAPFMAALEMIHTYSLVHDDLPAMDNDEYRRGRKTTHIVYGEGMAILAGDALLNYAFETAVRAFDMDATNTQIPKALAILAKKAGIFGMIGGQTADIEAEGNTAETTKEKLLFIHENKTAALMQSAMMIGAILAGASEEDVAVMEKIAYNVGIAFQIQDDILDITSSLEILGKQTGSDEKNEKVTYVTLEGIEKSKEEVERLSKEAVELLHSLAGENLFLEELLMELVTREK